MHGRLLVTYSRHTTTKHRQFSPRFSLFLFYFLDGRMQQTITLFFSPFLKRRNAGRRNYSFSPLSAPEMGETTDRFQSIGVVVVDVAPFYWHEIMRVQWKMVAITLSRLFLHRGYTFHPTPLPRNLWCVDEEKTQTIRIMADVEPNTTNRARRTPINTSWLS